MTKLQAPRLSAAPRQVRKQVAKLLDVIRQHLAAERLPHSERTSTTIAVFITLVIEQHIGPIIEAEDFDDRISLADFTADVVDGLALGCARVYASLVSSQVADPERNLELFVKLFKEYAGLELEQINRELSKSD